jgi:hypothetical protein
MNRRGRFGMAPLSSTADCELVEVSFAARLALLAHNCVGDQAMSHLRTQKPRKLWQRALLDVPRRQGSVTTGRLMAELEVEERLDAAIDKCLKRLRALKNLKRNRY